MNKLVVALSTLTLLAAAPLAAQAATPGPSSSSKHSTVRHHTAMSQTKKNACPAGSQSPSCQPSR